MPAVLYFKGINTNLKPNDPLLVVFAEFTNQQALHFVQDVEVQAEADRTRVTLQGMSTISSTPMMVASQVEAALQRYSDAEDFG